MRITSSDPSNIACVVTAGGQRGKVNAQALSHAWNQFNTLSAHFAQAFGPGTMHDAANTPTDIGGVGYGAFWIESQNTLYATNATDSQGGSYVTVTVTGRGSNASRMSLAEKLATATIAVAPHGPSPGAGSS
jgi:hypothetical protein